MIKVEFTAVFSTKVPGDTKEYEDQYAKWLIDEIKVAKRFHEPKAATKVEEPKLITKEEKHAANRTTKNAKG